METYVLLDTINKAIAHHLSYTRREAPGVQSPATIRPAGAVVGNQRIAVAAHRHPQAVPPVSGSFVGQLTHVPTMAVDVEVRALS